MGRPWRLYFLLQYVKNTMYVSEASFLKLGCLCFKTFHLQLCKIADLKFTFHAAALAKRWSEFLFFYPACASGNPNNFCLCHEKEKKPAAVCFGFNKVYTVAKCIFGFGLFWCSLWCWHMYIFRYTALLYKNCFSK